jgi:hypothetical protein
MEINNFIDNPYCSFEVSKLLKEKEFNVLPENTQPTDYIWGYVFDEDDEEDTLKVTEFQWEDAVQSHKFLRPIHGIAIEWIRVNFNHDIESRGVRYAGDEKSSYYQAYVNGCVISMERYNTPSEAVEAALLYTLENLIQ